MYAFLLLFSLFCFEFFHMFSHIIHINDSIQINILFYNKLIKLFTIEKQILKSTFITICKNYC